MREIDLQPQRDEARGSINIARPSHGGEEEYMVIEIHDEISGARFVEARVSLAGFMKAVTGQGYVPCWFTFRGSLVGMWAENKSELVGRPDYTTKNAKELLLANMQKFEVDGWKARESDLTNGHCHVQTKDGDFQRVTFFRHVNPETGEPVSK